MVSNGNTAFSPPRPVDKEEHSRYMSAFARASLQTNEVLVGLSLSRAIRDANRQVTIQPEGKDTMSGPRAGHEIASSGDPGRSAITET